MSEKSNDLILSVVTFTQEVLSALSLPGSSILEKSVEKALKKRDNEAREIVFKTIKQHGLENLKFEETDIDDFVPMMMRFVKASSEGAARKNLELLANVIFGLKKYRIFQFDNFRQYANIIETLTHDEILYIGILYNYYIEKNRSTSFHEFFDHLKKTFDGQKIYSISAALTRTGILLPVPALGNMGYEPAEILYELCKYADINYSS